MGKFDASSRVVVVFFSCNSNANKRRRQNKEEVVFTVIFSRLPSSRCQASTLRLSYLAFNFHLNKQTSVFLPFHCCPATYRTHLSRLSSFSLVFWVSLDAFSPPATCAMIHIELSESNRPYFEVIRHDTCANLMKQSHSTVSVFISMCEGSCSTYVQTSPFQLRNSIVNYFIGKIFFPV